MSLASGNIEMVKFPISWKTHVLAELRSREEETPTEFIQTFVPQQDFHLIQRYQEVPWFFHAPYL